LGQDEGLGGYLKGYVSAALICCGPWILTVLTLLGADLLMHALMGGMAAPNLFRLVIVYVYAFSLISTGALQTTVTRYLADRLYAEEPEHQLPTYLALCLINSPIQALLAWLGVAGLPIAVGVKVAAIALFVLVGNLWLLMIFLGAVRAYRDIVTAFVLGTLVSLLAMASLAGLGELGFLLGYLLGQTVAYVWMLRLLVREFPWKLDLDFGFVSYFFKYPALGAAGFLLNLGVWTGVFAYWLSPYATWHHGLPSYYPHHDVAVFLALLTMIPALVVFFVNTETDFYEGYRAFFGGITTGKVRLSELQRRKAEMSETLQSGFADIIKVQGLVTLVVALFPEAVFGFLELPEEVYPMVRNCAVGALLLVLFQCVTTILLYYEAYPQVAWSAFLLVAGNALGAWGSLGLGTWSHGLGLVLGSSMALVMASGQLFWVLHNLERVTFMGQPMPGQVVLPAGDADSAFGQTLMRDGQWLEGSGL